MTRSRKQRRGDDAEGDRGVLVESRRADERESPSHEALHPHEPNRRDGDSDVRVRQRERAELREKQRVAENFRDRVGAEECRDQRPHEEEQSLFLEL